MCNFPPFPQTMKNEEYIATQLSPLGPIHLELLVMYALKMENEGYDIQTIRTEIKNELKRHHFDMPIKETCRKYGMDYRKLRKDVTDQIILSIASRSPCTFSLEEVRIINDAAINGETNYIHVVKTLLEKICSTSPTGRYKINYGAV